MRFFNLSNRPKYKLAAIFLGASMAWHAQAATIVVDSLNGGSGGPTVCSLADAILSANTGSSVGGCIAGVNGVDDIIFDGSLSASVIPLTANLPPITDDLNIAGPAGSGQVTISGEGAYSIFIVEGVRLNLSNLHLTQGYATAVGNSPANSVPGNGGALAALSGSLVSVDHCRFTQNVASSRGGAIYAELSSVISIGHSKITNNTGYVGGGISTFSGAHVELFSSRLVNNSNGTSPSGWGGAITVGGSSLEGSSLSVRDTIFSNNTTNSYGGAIMANWGSTAEVLDSQFTGNSAHTGGAIRVQGDATASVSRSDFENNSAWVYGAAIGAEGGNLDVLNSTFSNNAAGYGGGAIFAYASIVNLNTITASENTAYKGGAIYTLGHPSFPLSQIKLMRSHLWGNSATWGDGGAITAESNAYVNMIDTTLSNNIAGQRGGAALIDASILEVVNSTVSGNDSGQQGGAVYATNSASVKLSNTTFAENIGGSVFAFNSTGVVLRNTVLAGGHCDLDSSSFVALNGGVHIDDGTCGATSMGPSQLGPLANNGSIIPTHLPIPGSPLIDHGVGNAGSNPANDQRGYSRIVGIAIDIGAVELSDPPVDELLNASASNNVTKQR